MRVNKQHLEDNVQYGTHLPTGSPNYSPQSVGHQATSHMYVYISTKPVINTGYIPTA
jgi:hypothetical protein